MAFADIRTNTQIYQVLGADRGRTYDEVRAFNRAFWDAFEAGGGSLSSWPY